MKFSKSFTVKGDIEKTFHFIQVYLPRQNCKTKNLIQPLQLVLERGSQWGSWASFKIENTKTLLTITLS